METIKFENARTRRTDRDIQGIWLGYTHLDFGARLVRWYTRKDGTRFLWYRHVTAYSDGNSYNLMLGELSATATYEELLAILAGCDDNEAVKRSAEIADEMGIEVPVDD